MALDIQQRLYCSDPRLLHISEHLVVHLSFMLNTYVTWKKAVARL